MNRYPQEELQSRGIGVDITPVATTVVVIIVVVLVVVVVVVVIVEAVDYCLRNNPKERSFQLLRGGSLKSRNV